MLEPFDSIVVFRCFEVEQKKLERIVRFNPEIESVSHLIRAYVMQGISRDYKKVIRAKGRPPKKDEIQRDNEKQETD